MHKLRRVELKKIVIGSALVIEVLLLLFLIPKVESGDLIFYKNLFNLYEDYSISDFIHLDTASIIGSRDYGFNLLVYSFSKILNFEIYIFIISLFYFISISKILIKKNLQYFIIFLPISFYIVGIQFSAIRLELAISIFIFFYYSNLKFIKYLSIFFHTQIIPIFLSEFNYKRNYIYIIIVILFISAVLFFNPHIIEKFILYSQENSEIKKNYVREFGLIIFSVFIVSLSNKKINYQYCLLAVCFFPLIFVLGAGRINIILFFLMLLNIKKSEKNNTYLNISLAIFFIYDVHKGLQFINGIISGNSGFNNINNIF